MLAFLAFLAACVALSWALGAAFSRWCNRRECRREGHVWKKDRPGVERCVRCPERRLVDEPPCDCTHDRFNHINTGWRDECAVVGCPCACYVPAP